MPGGLVPSNLFRAALAWLGSPVMKIGVTPFPLIFIVEGPWAREPDRPGHESCLCGHVSKTRSLRHLCLPIKWGE